MFPSLAQETAARQQVGQKHDSAAGVGPYLHGANGLFSLSGQDPRVFSAIRAPLGGMLNRLRVIFNGDLERSFGGTEANYYTLLTGVTASNQTLANQPTAICNPFPTGGLMKTGSFLVPYGRMGFSIQPIDLTEVGTLRDLADPRYLQLQNPPGLGGDNLMPQAGRSSRNLLYNVLHNRLYNAALGFRLYLAQLLWTANPATTAASNKYKEFIGFNLFVNENTIRDVQSSGILTAANSYLDNFDFNLISGALNVWQRLDFMLYSLEYRDQQQGLGPVQRVVVMRPELYREIVKVVPVQAYVEALQTIGQYLNGRVVINAQDAFNMRNDMLMNPRLPLNGKMVDVVLDDGIPELNVTTSARLSAGQYASDIYMIPETVLGGTPVTYIEPYLQDNGLAEEIAREARLLHTWTTDGGLFRMYSRQTDECFTVSGETKFRLVMHTPQLAGRLTNVAYQPIRHLDSPFPGDAYFANSGVTERTAPSFYVPWQSTPFSLSNL